MTENKTEGIEKKSMAAGTGLILEGGGSRGVFTAGALDYLMGQNVTIPYVVGVSAGACNALDYTSGQIGRTKDCMIIKEKAYQYVSVRNIIRHRSLFDMDMIFDKFPNKYIPFDYSAFFQSEITCEMAVTNCITGKAEYYGEAGDAVRLMQLCRASSSLPMAAPMVYIDGVPYLDGGIGDSIPISHSIRLGNTKNVVILTRKKGYRKKTDSRNASLIRRYYHAYPRLAQSLVHRPYVYNRTLDLLDELEKQKRVFILRPEDKVVGRAEKNNEKLEAFYQHGCACMKDQFEALMEYLNS